jgi:GNAT superfamily N-acetyltransferase
MLSSNTSIKIRPLDPERDMPAVLDLVELGFGDELDPQGWKMLRQMRQIYQPNALARAVYGSVSDTDGFVCQEADRIVANLSLRRAYPHISHGRLIGNVVVHPDYRGQGIGRALMERAMQAARLEQASWVGLEVRADNVIACALYEHLGFHAVGTTEHMLRPKGLVWPDFARPDTTWRRFNSSDSDRWRELAAQVHDHDQQLVLEVRRDLFGYRGIERWLDRVLTRQIEGAWVHPTPGNAIDLAVHRQTDRKHYFHIWDVLVQPHLGANGAREAIAQCLTATRKFPTWPVVAMVADQSALVELLRTIGFQIHRTLQQMISWL